MTTSIINCGGVVFVTRSMPFGDPVGILPSRQGQKTIGVEADVRLVADNSFFIVIISDQTIGRPDSTPEEWAEKVRQVMQFVWNDLVNRGVEWGLMPEITEGSPLDMVGVTTSK